MHFGALQQPVPLIQRRFVRKRRKRTQKIVKTAQRARERLVDILYEQRFGLLVGKMRLEVVVGSKQLILTLKLSATMRQLAVELIELMNVLGKKGAPAHQRKGTIHHIGLRNHGKGMHTTVLLCAQLIAHAIGKRLRCWRSVRHLKITCHDLEVKRQRIEDARNVVIRGETPLSRQISRTTTQKMQYTREKLSLHAHGTRSA